MIKKLSLLLISFLLFTLTACNTESTQSTQAPKLKFNERVAMEEKGDGWIYFFDYAYGEAEKYYGFNGYNLKYKHIDGLYIPVIDAKTGEIIDKATSGLPYLSLNQELKPDIKEIQNFFSKNQFVVPIESSDLDELNISKINKEDVLRLFNQAMEKGDLTWGKAPLTLPQANIFQEALLSGYQWQVGFFIVYGNILKVRIELIYDGDIYLSDLVSGGKADESQKDIYNKIKEIENKIMSEQRFDVDMDNELTINNIQFKRLYTMLQKLQAGGYPE